MKKFREFVAEAKESPKHKFTTHDIHPSDKLPKKEGDTFRLTNREGTYRAVAHQGNLWHGNVVYAHRHDIKEAVETKPGVKAAVETIAAHTGGKGSHFNTGGSVSHKPTGGGFFDHGDAHDALKKDGWKKGKPLSTDHGKGTGAIYSKGEHKVSVVTRHNPNQNTTVHSVLHHED